ncbi:MAG: RluA family pseudouridine synthase [Acidobacteriota bacterium]
MGSFRFRIPDPLSGERLDRIVAARVEGLSRTAARKLIAEGRVRVQGHAMEPDSRPKAGLEVEGTLPDPPPQTLAPESFNLDVLYEDDYLMVIDKPSGLSVHPGAGRREGTLVNQLLGSGRTLSAVGAPERPGIVHRLDLETSGCLLVARTDQAHHGLASQFQDRSIDKEYRALVWGNVARSKGRIEAPIGRHPVHRTRMAVRQRTGRAAVTQYTVVAKAAGLSWLALRPLTGRTHQIRVHMASLGHPVAGDPVYGRCPKNPPDAAVRALEHCPRLVLHASRLAFDHPVHHRRLEVESPLPIDIANLLVHLGITN